MDPTSKIIRALIMALVILVALGYVFIWTMEPTNRYYLKWTPKIRAAVNSTYFGIQGATILINTFPVLFVAVLGCVYLHLGKSNSFSNQKGIHTKRWLAIWRKPMIIKGLGIVSQIELAFFLMFIALLVWCLYSYFHSGFAEITRKSAAQMGMKVWEVKLKFAGIFLGLAGNLGLTFLFFPVSRGSSLLPIFGLTSEASIKYHIWLGHIVLAIFTAHGVCYVVFWAVTHQLSEASSLLLQAIVGLTVVYLQLGLHLHMLKWAKTGISNVAGEIALVAGLAMWVTTFPRIRRKMFEVFFYTHHLYILFVVFFVFHVGISYALIMLPGFYLFIIDRYVRFLQSRQGVRLVSARVLPCETVELNFSKSKGLIYSPTSIIFVNIPSISKLQWHPFTITSSSGLEPEKLSVMIKGEGKWSKSLHRMLSSPSSIDCLDVSVEGPYGPVSVDFLRHELLVMISGGSGITPFISIIRELMHVKESLKCKTPKVILITAFKNSSDLTMLDLILPISGAPSQFSELDLQIEAYVTREKQPAAPSDKMNLRAVWLKPKPSDAPIAPVLGKNNWLCLGSIISSSFIGFLLLMGLVSRYYIYPIDHNTDHIYSHPLRALIEMLLLCIGIIVAATAAFLYNKRQNSAENKQVKNINGTTPVASPESWLYNADEELESLPHQSLLECTNVHYGERPDLKRILFERKESSVGVLVCGPKRLRHDAANICSSGLAANLYFESISFSW